MKKICEHCIYNECSYKSRGLENKCEKVQDYEQGYEDAVENGDVWHDAESDDLPDYDKEVIALLGTEPYYRVCFAHRPNPNGWDAKNLTTGRIEHHQAETYGKGGWNIHGVKWWIDVELPKVEEEEQ